MSAAFVQNRDRRWPSSAPAGEASSPASRQTRCTMSLLTPTSLPPTCGSSNAWNHLSVFCVSPPGSWLAARASAHRPAVPDDTCPDLPDHLPRTAVSSARSSARWSARRGLIAGKELSFRQHQNQFGAEHESGRQRARLRDSGKFVALGVAQGQMGGNRHTDIYASPALTVTLRHATRELIEDSVLHDRRTHLDILLHVPAVRTLGVLRWQRILRSTTSNFYSLERKVNARK